MPNEPLASLSKQEIKEIAKAAIDEWLDKKFLLFGKWSFFAFGASLIAAITYFMLMLSGWSRT